jgi:hypothetical protein
MTARRPARRTARRTSRRVNRRQEAVRAAMAPPPVQQPPPPAAAPAPAAGGMTSDQIDRLKELASLREQGILTDDEFAAQKAKLLG